MAILPFSEVVERVIACANCHVVDKKFNHWWHLQRTHAGGLMIQPMPAFPFEAHTYVCGSQCAGVLVQQYMDGYLNKGG